MTANPLKSLRIVVITLLIFLAIQFEFGMAVNLSDVPSITPLNYSFAILFAALNQAGAAAMIHAVFGTVIIILSLVSLLMSLAAKIRSVQIFGALGFLTMLLAGISGLLFVLSGFQNNHYSHGMATNFILAFGFYFLELYFLKPNPALG